MTRSYTVRELLQMEVDDSPKCTIFINDNENVYRYGESDIDLKFAQLKDALFVLARTGEVDGDALRNGETILPTLIGGIRREEESTKKCLNPHGIERAILLDNFLSGDSHPKVRPNDIDAEQQYVLSAYLDFKGVRELLEVMLPAVQQINLLIGRTPPDKDVIGPTL